MPVIFHSRQEDFVLLTMIKERQRGRTSTDLARRFGFSPEFVRTATLRVKKADIAESGENERFVAKHYEFVEGGKRCKKR